MLQPHALCCNRMHCVAIERHLCTINPAADVTCCNRLNAAALPCHWLHPIQASEAKAPLPESRGVCAALWPRMGSDVSEAVRLAAPRIPAAGRARATGSQDSADVRVAAFGSEQPRPTSALCLGLGLGLRVGQRTRAQHGPTALRWWPRRDGASMSVEAEPCLLLGGAARAGCQCATGPACGSLAEGWGCRIRGRFARWAWRPAGGVAGAQDGGASRCQFGQAPTVEVGPRGRLVSRRGS